MPFSGAGRVLRLLVPLRALIFVKSIGKPIVKIDATFGHAFRAVESMFVFRIGLGDILDGLFAGRPTNGREAHSLLFPTLVRKRRQLSDPVSHIPRLRGRLGILKSIGIDHLLNYIAGCVLCWRWFIRRDCRGYGEDSQEGDA